MNNWDYEFRGYNLGRYVMPLYAFAVPDAETGKTQFHYMFRTNFIKPTHIEQLHNNMIKAIRLGTQNPDLTVGELFDLLDDLK